MDVNDALIMKGVRVLIVEDETLVAMLVEEYLLEIGCVIAGSVRRVDKAMERVETDVIDAAILDLNVAGEDVAPVAEALEKRNIPFVFASGYGGNGVKDKWSDRPIVQKPFTSAELKQALSVALSGRARHS
jgi:CheY-like chemotaxis protein